MPKRNLEALMAGNVRYAAGNPESQPATASRTELASGQAPFATILSCSDSRVPVETIFDHGPGDIFVVRVAGNFVNDDGLGSIEFAVHVLKSHLIMVLGHTACGAVSAAIETIERDQTVFPGYIQRLADAIQPAARAARSQNGDWYANAIEENVRMSVAALTERSEILAEAVRSGEAIVVGAVYDLHSGEVKLLDT